MTASELFIASVEANKREMFDAMRAYQESEQAHKQDAIGLLTTILTAAGAIFAAIIVPEKPIPHSDLIAALSAIAATILAAVVVRTTNAKIAADHEIYAHFGDEYVRCCEFLELFENVQIGGTQQPVKVRAEIGHGKGWKFTQSIVKWVGATVAAFSWCAFFYVFFNIDNAAKRHSATSAQVMALPASKSSQGGAQPPCPPERVHLAHSTPPAYYSIAAILLASNSPTLVAKDHM